MKRCPTWKLFKFSRSTTLMLCKNWFDQRLKSYFWKHKENLNSKDFCLFQCKITLNLGWNERFPAKQWLHYILQIHPPQNYNHTSYSNKTIKLTLEQFIITQRSLKFSNRPLLKQFHTWSTGNKCSFIVQTPRVSQITHRGLQQFVYLIVQEKYQLLYRY